ncbi:unnamed protein product [Mycena citricolor]|uniref:Uncharacterized protein n=1 Tax=Mycena citricolor TaxID=2018698 RepID=A0AAD2H8D5_9AGAR|nr:unnamed protein product [Mycena citricolor]CAK5271855.1 unnamed protein product [Mycena citricolor]
MKFAATAALVAVAVSVAALPVRRGVNTSLIVPFGINPGAKDPAGSASCVGINGILIPCSCPPDLASFTDSLNANVAAGHAINNPGIGAAFPEDGSIQSQITRLNAQTVTLQNLHGPGVGCPQAATNWGGVLQKLQAGISENLASPPPPPTPAAPAPPPPPPAAPAAGGVDPALVPQFDVTPGIKDPAGSASCVGINNILIPCSCPPSREEFIASLSANVAAGHAVNNPGVASPFPTDGSPQAAVTRMQSALVALQNLHGPGVGCPAVSTTFSAQLSALQARV